MENHEMMVVKQENGLDTVRCSCGWESPIEGNGRYAWERMSDSWYEHVQEVQAE